MAFRVLWTVKAGGKRCAKKKQYRRKPVTVSALLEAPSWLVLPTWRECESRNTPNTLNPKPLEKQTNIELLNHWTRKAVSPDQVEARNFPNSHTPKPQAGSQDLEGVSDMSSDDAWPSSWTIVRRLNYMNYSKDPRLRYMNYNKES